MAGSNGRLPDSELMDIPGGRLNKDGAAQGWNAGPAKLGGCRPLGPNSSYRTYEKQVEYYHTYGAGNAAYPGTSNHGMGHAVDLSDGGGAMRTWIIENGHEYGWYWGEVSHEMWHVTFNGNYDGKPAFNPLRYGKKNNKARVRQLHKLLRHAGGVLPNKKRRYRYWRGPWTKKFTKRTKFGVKRFQKDHKLKPDGVVGPKTWKKLRHVGQKDAD